MSSGELKTAIMSSTMPATWMRNGFFVSCQFMITKIRLTNGMNNDPRPHQTLFLKVTTSNQIPPTTPRIMPRMSNAVIFPTPCRVCGVFLLLHLCHESLIHDTNSNHPPLRYNVWLE